MNKNAFMFSALVCFATTVSHAQLSVKLHTGISYLEHLSIGPALSFSDKHTVSFLYGSNLFVKTKDFSTYMLEYSLKFDKLLFQRLTPAIGIKGGHIIYSDDYYRWEVASIIPFARIHYKMNIKIDLFADAGISFSFEQKVKRISFGEIGKYKDLLPELKFGMMYAF